MQGPLDGAIDGAADTSSVDASAESSADTGSLAEAGAGGFSVLYVFQGSTADADAANPKRALAPGANDTLYGVARAGGAANLGAVFQLVPPVTPSTKWTSSILHSFTGASTSPGSADGSQPDGDIFVNAQGAILGTASTGGTHVGTMATVGLGTAFSLSPPTSSGGSWTETTLADFGGASGAPALPYAGLTPGSNGVLYGTTFDGGTDGQGCVYSLTPPGSPSGSWTLDVLYNFTGTNGDGANPHASVFVGDDGVLYGTTLNGGDIAANPTTQSEDGGNIGPGYGIVYSLTPPSSAGGGWTRNIIHTFSGPDGGSPHSALVPDASKTLYGTTIQGGSAEKGTVFSLTPAAGGSWTFATLYDFAAPDDGGDVRAGVLPAPGGLLYGCNISHGSGQDGTLFQLAPPSSGSGPWTETILHSFSGADGSQPFADLLLSGGTLYGTTQYGGGSANAGVAFAYTP